MHYFLNHSLLKDIKLYAKFKFNTNYLLCFSCRKKPEENTKVNVREGEWVKVQYESE